MRTPPIRRSTRRSWMHLPAICLVLLLSAAACTSGRGGVKEGQTSPPVASHRITGWLHTDGMSLLDSQGRLVRLLGVNIQGMGKGSGETKQSDPSGKGWSMPTPPTYDNVAAWGFNSVRVPIAWANIEPEAPTQGTDGTFAHHYNEAYLSALDSIVANFGHRGTAVILCMCQHKWSPGLMLTQGGRRVPGSGMPAWLYPGSTYRQVYQAKRDFFSNVNHAWEWFADVWKEVASRYANDPTVVGLDVLNEPYYGTDWLPSPDDLHLDALYKDVGTAIRSVNPRVLMIFEDSQDRGDGRFGMQGPPPFQGVVYSFHLYTDNWEPEGLARTKDYWGRANTWQVPVWIGEFNRFGSGEGDWQDPLKQMLDYAKGLGIDWAYWAYRGRDALADDQDRAANPELLQVLQSGF